MGLTLEAAAAREGRFRIFWDMMEVGYLPPPKKKKNTNATRPQEIRPY